MSPFSNDPRDIAPIAPSHFLTVRLITRVPEPKLTLNPDNRLGAL